MAEDARSDDETYRAHARALADAVDAALASWVVRSVEQRARESGLELSPAARNAAEEAGRRCVAEVGPQVRDLLLTDPDEQRTTPLVMLRSATRYATGVLHALGVPPVDRDEFAVRAFPGDAFDLAPASFAAVDPRLQEPGLVWGAAKAHVHLARRRAEGRR